MQCFRATVRCGPCSRTPSVDLPRSPSLPIVTANAGRHLLAMPFQHQASEASFAIGHSYQCRSLFPCSRNRADSARQRHQESRSAIQCLMVQMPLRKPKKGCQDDYGRHDNTLHSPSAQRQPAPQQDCPLQLAQAQCAGVPPTPARLASAPLVPPVPPKCAPESRLSIPPETGTVLSAPASRASKRRWCGVGVPSLAGATVTRPASRAYPDSTAPSLDAPSVNDGPLQPMSQTQPTLIV